MCALQPEVEVGADSLLGFPAQVVPHLLAIPEDLQHAHRIGSEAFLLGGEDVDPAVQFHEVVSNVRPKLSS
jgi:hypothetical protein